MSFKVNSPYPQIFLLSAILGLVCCVVSCDNYYKLCNDQCVMRGSFAGQTYDLPCTDNVSLMVMRKKFPTYTASNLPKTTELNSFLNFPASIALHEPIYPEVLPPNSEDITFKLDPAGNSEIRNATLTIRKNDVKPDDILLSRGDISISSTLISTVSWKKLGGEGYERDVAGDKTNVPKIYYTTAFDDIPAGLVTFVTYQFGIEYENGTRETKEITFALRNFHAAPSLEKFPAPIYAQGDKASLTDILFIPACDHNQTEPLTRETLDLFRSSCGSIIRNAFFEEPILRFYANQFNFWINKQEGKAADYQQCPQCSHCPPSNFEEIISEDFEFRALLHKASQRDFTDNHNFFSARMGNDCDANAFIHELGHAAFNLSDEYADGYLHEERDLNLPNNWEQIATARNDAVSRHKKADDAKAIK